MVELVYKFDETSVTHKKINDIFAVNSPLQALMVTYTHIYTYIYILECSSTLYVGLMGIVQSTGMVTPLFQLWLLFFLTG